MIKTKKDLMEYLEADKKALKREGKYPRITDLVWKYQILLRKCEYYENCKSGFVNKLIFKYYRLRMFMIGSKCNFSIPLNVFGKGLSIAHIGPIVVNSGAKIGENCRIHVGVNIGTQAGSGQLAPVMGDNTYIGPGAKLFGKIKIADNIAIGANAVVNKDFLESNISIGGVPAKKISDRGPMNFKI